MYHLDVTLPTLAENLALDEALVLDAEAGGPEVLRLWRWPQLAVVLGAGGRLADDVDEAACLADGVSIMRRSSGGGTVLLGPGCLLFGLILRFDRDPTLAD
jgi:lipoate-protein ligase A